MFYGGKFAQNEDRVEILYVKTYEELSTLLENPIYENIHFDYSNHVIRVSCRKKVSHIAHKSNTNIIIGCFVTFFARLRLYDALISLPQDYIIYYSENGEEFIKCSLFVGELETELNHGEFTNVVVNDSDIFVDVEENQIVKNDKLCVFTRKVKKRFGYTFDK